jgi:hypothetical protein
MCDICTKLYTARTYSFLFRSSSGAEELLLSKGQCSEIYKDFFMRVTLNVPVVAVVVCFPSLAVPENCRFVQDFSPSLNQMQCCMSGSCNRVGLGQVFQNIVFLFK